MSIMEVGNVADEFEAALLRVMALEKMDCSVLLNHIAELKNQMIELQSRKTYAIKEVDTVHDGEEDPDVPLEKQKNKTAVEILELTNAKLHHKLFRDTFQKATFNVQMQAAVHESLKDMDMDENLENSSDVGKLLEHHSNNLHTSKELLSLIDKKEQLDADILSAKVKYADLLGNIKKKWKIYQGKAISPEDMEDEDLATLRRKFDTREDKLKIMVHMIQNLISSSGKLWGADDYDIQVLLLCECVHGDASRSEIDRLIEKISRISEGKAGRKTSKPEPVKGKAVFISSTPMSKRVRL